MSKAPKLNGMSIAQVTKRISQYGTRSEIAREMGVTNAELTFFIKKHIVVRFLKETKIMNRMLLIESITRYTVRITYPEKSVLKTTSEFVLKSEAGAEKLRDDLVETMKQKLIAKNRVADIGVIVPDVEYTIPGINLRSSNIRQSTNDVGLIINVRKGKFWQSSLLCKDYPDFCHNWNSLTASLSDALGFDEKPAEWEPPSEVYYENYRASEYARRLSKESPKS